MNNEREFPSHEQRAALRRVGSVERANDKFDQLCDFLPEGFHVGYTGNVDRHVDDRAWTIFREHGEKRPYTAKDTIGNACHKERYKLNKWINAIRFAHGMEVYTNANS